MELKDTISLMASADYKDRFLAEYWQVKIRYDKLKAMCEKWDKGELNFTPTCGRSFYNRQLWILANYIEVLQDRAVLEDVKLEENKND